MTRPGRMGSLWGLCPMSAAAAGPGPLRSLTMGQPLSQRRRAPGVALLALLAAGCGHNEVDPFPLAVGFQPLEGLVAGVPWPAPTATDPHPEGLGTIVTAPGAGHYASHARGYIHAPLAKVYAALRVPAASYIHNSGGGTRLDGDPLMDVEPFPISFRVRYANATVIGDVKFDVTYRGGPSQGTELAPLVVGQRYQKTWGTSHIQLMAGSLVATAVDGAPDVTSVEMVAWLEADTQGQADCNGTLADLFGDLAATLASMP